ncbi:MAG: hypothetical protein PVI26_05545 [Chitinispirillia bacterium]|jgi:hypothetical protein
MKNNNNNGITLLELLLSIFASSLIITAIGGLYVSYMKSNMKMKELMKLRTQFSYANQLLERDIRMSGFNLPGNGILVNSGVNTMFLLKNEEGKQTRLSVTANMGDNSILVEDDKDVSIEDWVCLNDPASGNTEYLQIISDPEIHEGSWRVSFGSEVLENTWDMSNTDVYFAKAVRYSVDGTEPDVAFVRSTPQKDFKISKDITKFVIKPFDAQGVDLTDLMPDASDLIRKVGIELIKPIPEHNNSISSSIEVSIRNSL